MTSTEPAAGGTPPPCVLVIDDEPQIRRFLDISLRAQGLATVLAEDGRAGLAALAGAAIDLVILDLGLPDLDGHEVLVRLRQVWTVPVIVLSVRAGEAEKVAALDAGANDYVTKPFGVAELMARVRGLLRLQSHGPEQPAGYADDRLRVDLERREVRLDGVPLVLTRKEFLLLSILVRHPGRVLTQPQLLREIWGPTHVEDTHYLRILVGKLRQKLGDDAARPHWIATEPGVGLRFLGCEG